MSHTTYTARRLYTALSDQLLTPGAITIQGESIIDVGSPEFAPSGGERIDLGDVTLMPGLIDVHVHLTFSASETVVEDYLADSSQMHLIRGVENARRALYAGITTVRECGGQNDEVFALREASQRGLIQAPRIIAAGASITTTGGHCWFFGLEADTEDELRRAVRSQIKAGADYIKVMATGGGLTPRTNPAAAQYNEQQLRAIVEEATRMANLRISAHCHGTPGILYAARAGVTTIEHCSFQYPGGYAYDDQAAQAVKESGCYVCPTIAIAERASHNLPADNRIVQMRQRILPPRVANLRRLHTLGVPLISGSDAGVTMTPFEDFAYNVTMLVDEVGLSNHYALESATIRAAAALGRPDLGALEIGRAADLLAVGGNPLEDIHALWDVQAVVARGKRIR